MKGFKGLGRMGTGGMNSFHQSPGPMAHRMMGRPMGSGVAARAMGMAPTPKIPTGVSPGLPAGGMAPKLSTGLGSSLPTGSMAPKFPNTKKGF